MKIKIMKFGGTSLSDPEKIRLAAGRAAAEKKRGFSVVLVLSAPGQVTDELLELARRLAPAPRPRELDALLSTGENISAALAAMALEAEGHRAVSLSGAQAGILTDSAFSNASVLALNPKRIIAELKKGKIAVVAGFQGVNRSGDITTLGRGGSDLTAVALAGALKAEICELYSDVKGIYTANPAIVSSARKLPRVSYDEVIALAEAGTEVRQLVAGIRRSYTPEQLVGRRVVIVANLAPAVIRGVASQGMILAASDDQGISVLAPDRDVALGSTVK